MKVVVVGAGGHGRVVADVLIAAHRNGQVAHPIGHVDDRASSAVPDSPALPLLGALAQLPQIDHDAIVVAIGNNEIRARVMSALAAGGEKIITTRHPSVIVGDDVQIGDGSMLCAGAIVITGSRIGRGVILNTGSTIDHHTIVGDFVHIAPGVHVGGNVSIGDHSLIGIGAVVLPRIAIGARAIVGAGAVVTRDVAPGATVVGVPARILHS